MHIESLVYRASPIPSGGLEIPLRLTFSCPKEDIMSLMNNVLITLNSWTFTGEMKENNDSEEKMNIVMRITDEKKIEEIEGTNDESIDIGKA